MGIVYLVVRDDAQFQKRAALKLIRAGMDTAELLLRFRHERQILASLDHPYIARLIDGGTTPEGRPFLVMDYVEGLRIDNWCRRPRPGRGGSLPLVSESVRGGVLCASQPGGTPRS